MKTNINGRFAHLDPDEFTRLVAQTWRAYGWEVVDAAPAECPDGIGDVTAPIDDGSALLVRSAHPRGVLTVPGESQLSAATLLAVLSEVETPSDLLIAAAAGYETGGLSVADAYGVELVEPSAIQRLRESTTAGKRPEA